jgi:hypothetical protein
MRRSGPTITHHSKGAQILVNKKASTIARFVSPKLSGTRNGNITMTAASTTKTTPSIKPKIRAGDRNTED